MKTLRIAFAGTPEFSLPSLEQLIGSPHEVVMVMTQPDRKAGRGRKLTPSPVKARAIDAGLPVDQPQTLRNEEGRQELADSAPHLLVVIAYGLILPQTVLDMPQHGCWNLHASLLPRWRGAAPIQRAIEAGDTTTGVCLMQMEAGLDTGPVIDCQQTAIKDQETGGSLHDRLSHISAELLGKWLERLANGEAIPARTQEEDTACYAPKLEKSEALLNLHRPAVELSRKVRAFNPWPVAQVDLAGEQVRVWRAQPVRWPGKTEIGAVMGASAQGIDLGTGQDLLRIIELQRPGGRRIGAADYLNARQDLRR